MSTKFESGPIALRAFEAEDTDALARYLNHPHLRGRRYIPWRFPAVTPLSAAQLEELVTTWQKMDKNLHLAVINQLEDVLIGHVVADWSWDALSPDIAVAIAPEYQRLGFGSLALEMILEYLFTETPAHCVHADWVAEWNQPALDFLAASGFQHAGRARWAGLHEGRPVDMIAADLLRREWLERQRRGHGSAR